MKYKVLFLFVLTLFLFLTACGKKEEVVNFKNKDISNTLIVQKVENNISSGQKTKVIQDKQKIKEILTMVEGLKVEKADKNTTLNTLKTTNVYMLAFSEGDLKNIGKTLPYAFDVLNDGTFIFLSNDFNMEPNVRITIQTHKDLLQKMKKTLGIDF